MTPLADSAEHSLSGLDLYRFKEDLFNSGRVAERDAIDEALERQYEAAGCRLVLVPGTGWHWEGPARALG